jgi:hypothetical protein
MKCREVLREKLGACSARDDIGDNLDFGEMPRDGFDVFSAYFQ